MKFTKLLLPLVFSFSVLSLSSYAEENYKQPGLKLPSQEDINRYQIMLVDDNPFLNLVPGLKTEDDFGYSYGLRISHTRIKPEGRYSANERWNIELATDIYTQNATPDGQNLFPHTPQKFNEISSVKVTWDDLFNKIDSDQLYYVIGAGIGLKNDKKDSGILAMGHQKVWHKFKHDKLTPDETEIYDNQPGDTYEPYVSVTAAIGRVVSFSDKMRECACEIDRFKVQGGVEVLSIRQGSRIYFLAAVNKSVLTIAGRNLSVEAEVEANQYGDGNRDVRKTVGVRYTGRKWSAKTGFTFISGSQNQDFLQYVDKDPIWSLLVERTLQPN